MAAKGFIQLLRLAEIGRQRGQQVQDRQADRWSGVAFTLAGFRFVAPLGEVAEVLRVPEFTPVHGTHRWLLGLANVRGRLLSLNDLSSYAGVTSTQVPVYQSKVIVIDQGELFSGLLVDEVQGIQHFNRATYDLGHEALPEKVLPYVQGRFRRQDEFWHVFMLSALVADPRFLNAGV